MKIRIHLKRFLRSEALLLPCWFSKRLQDAAPAMVQRLPQPFCELKTTSHLKIRIQMNIFLPSGRAFGGHFGPPNPSKTVRRRLLNGCQSYFESLFSIQNAYPSKYLSLNASKPFRTVKYISKCRFSFGLKAPLAAILALQTGPRRCVDDYPMIAGAFLSLIFQSKNAYPLKYLSLNASEPLRT